MTNTVGSSTLVGQGFRKVQGKTSRRPIAEENSTLPPAFPIWKNAQRGCSNIERSKTSCSSAVYEFQLSFLEESLEVYIETFKHHDNRPDLRYKLYGQDFVLDLLGVLDLLWPLVLPMLQSQASWCPG